MTLKIRVSTTEQAVTPLPVLLIGEPGLRQVCAPVSDVSAPTCVEAIRSLHATLADFRAQRGFGRAIAASQVGIAQRIIALDLGDGPQTLINPEITWRSDATFTLWDDCLSFPFLMVRVRRHRSLSLRFCNERGAVCEWNRVDRALSELLQHEIDHLDGILATDRALDAQALVSREVFLATPETFRRQVDYMIGDPSHECGQPAFVS